MNKFPSEDLVTNEKAEFYKFLESIKKYIIHAEKINSHGKVILTDHEIKNIVFGFPNGYGVSLINDVLNPKMYSAVVVSIDEEDTAFPWHMISSSVRKFNYMCLIDFIKEVMAYKNRVGYKNRKEIL